MNRGGSGIRMQGDKRQHLNQSSMRNWVVIAVFVWICCLLDASYADGPVDPTQGQSADDSALITASTQSLVGVLAEESKHEVTGRFSVCGMFQRCDLCVKPHLVRGINPFTDVENCVWDKVAHKCTSATLPWDKTRYDCETYCRGANAMLTSLPQALFPHRLCEMHVCPYVTNAEVCPLTQDSQLSRSIVADSAYLGDPNSLDRLAAMYLLGKTLLPRMRDVSGLYRHAATTFLESQSTATAEAGVGSAEMTISKAALRHATTVNAMVSRGVRDVLGGLAYSIASNLFNRVRIADCDSNYRKPKDRFGYYLNIARRCSRMIQSGGAKGCYQWQAFMEEPSKCDLDFPAPKTVVYTAGAKIKQAYRAAARGNNIGAQLSAASQAFKLVTDKDKASGDSELLTIAGLYAIAQSAPPGVTITHVVEHYGNSMDSYPKASSTAGASLAELSAEWPGGRGMFGAKPPASKPKPKKMVRLRSSHEHHYLLVGASHPHQVKPSDAASAQHAFIIDFWAAAAGGPRYVVHDIPFTAQGDSARVGIARSTLDLLDKAAKRGGKLPEDPKAKKPAKKKSVSKKAKAALVDIPFGSGILPATEFVDEHHSPHVARHNLKRAQRIGVPFSTGHYRGGGAGGLGPANAGSSPSQGSGVIRGIIDVYSQRGQRERYAIRIKSERVGKAKSKAKGAALSQANGQKGSFEERLEKEKRRRAIEKENWLRRWKAVRRRQGFPEDDPRPSLLESSADIGEDAAAEKAYIAQAKFLASRAEQSLRSYLNSIYGFDSRGAQKVRETIALNRALLNEELSGAYTVTALHEKARSLANLTSSEEERVHASPDAMRDAQGKQSLLSDDVLREVALNIPQHVAVLMAASQIGDIESSQETQSAENSLDQIGASEKDHISARSAEALDMVLSPSFAHPYSPASNAKDLELAANLLSGGSLVPIQKMLSIPQLSDAKPRIFALVKDAAKTVKLVRALQLVQEELDTPGASALIDVRQKLSDSAVGFNLDEFVNSQTDVFEKQRIENEKAKAEEFARRQMAQDALAARDFVSKQAHAMLKEMWELPDASARRIELGRRAAFAEHLYQKVQREYEDLLASADQIYKSQTGGLMSLLESASASESLHGMESPKLERSSEDMLTLADEIAEMQANLGEILYAPSQPQSESSNHKDGSSLMEVQSQLKAGAALAANADLVAELQAEIEQLRLAEAEESESAALRLEEQERHAEMVAKLMHGEEGKAALAEAVGSIHSLSDADRHTEENSAEAEFGARLKEEREALRRQWQAWLQQDQADLESVLGENLTPHKVIQTASKLATSISP